MTTTAEKNEKGKGDEPEPEVIEIPPCTGSLAQRILAIKREIGAVAATGQNFAKGSAISIEDVAFAVRPLEAKHGVFIRFSRLGAEDLGGGKNWRVDLKARIENAEKPEEFFEDEWTETGMNLSAAYSYGRKSYKKMLYDIAAKDDDDDSKQRSTVPPARSGPVRPPQADSPDGDVDLSNWGIGSDCPVPDCTGKVGGTRTAPKCSLGHTPGGPVEAEELPIT